MLDRCYNCNSLVFAGNKEACFLTLNNADVTFDSFDCLTVAMPGMIERARSLHTEAQRRREQVTRSFRPDMLDAKPKRDVCAFCGEVLTIASDYADVSRRHDAHVWAHRACIPLREPAGDREFICRRCLAPLSMDSVIEPFGDAGLVAHVQCPSAPSEVADAGE